MLSCLLVGHGWNLFMGRVFVFFYTVLCTYGFACVKYLTFKKLKHSKLEGAFYGANLWFTICPCIKCTKIDDLSSLFHNSSILYCSQLSPKVHQTLYPYSFLVECNVFWIRWTYLPLHTIHLNMNFLLFTWWINPRFHACMVEHILYQFIWLKFYLWHPILRKQLLSKKIPEICPVTKNNVEASTP